MAPTPEDVEAVRQQLGRAPKGEWEVASRCPSGHPQVVRVYPIVDGKPFPNLYWLCCPNINAQISRLEITGIMKEVLEALQSDPSMREGLHKNHEDYAKERQNLLRPEHQSFLDDNEPMSVRIKHGGIGGSQSKDGVRCLHVMYAHHLVSGDNVVGLWLDRNYPIVQCTGRYLGGVDIKEDAAVGVDNENAVCRKVDEGGLVMNAEM
eukprot:comp84833_c0_seq1/m.48445 comp84833_c0_seq1/g.48445  ORF comp84833_c0_seq1/g.48445 comp84833_c0_seq1/m.48445 type:complete len:207 (-) comp84833_c0_seq1:95-715(-)